MSLMEYYHLFLSTFYALILLYSLADAAPVGVCYGQVGNGLPTIDYAINLIKSNGISRIRIFDVNPDVLQAFSGTNIELMVGVPNEILPLLANGTTYSSLQWLQTNIFDHIAVNQIRYIGVGNEIFLKDTTYTPYVLPVIHNLYEALYTLGLSEKIKLSSPCAASIVSHSYPPSLAIFDPNLRYAIVPLLQFLHDTSSPLMVNVYPFFSYTNDPEHVSLEYALFKTNDPVYDCGLPYTNLFDATIDAVVSAMEKEGFGGIEIVVTETGWPTSGGIGASVDNALVYNDNVVRKVKNNVGSPKRPGTGVEVFLFDLFDENEKDGEEFERHFGIFGLDGVKAYDLSFNLVN
ncbi:Glycoside hydrolase family 17 [Dillenia turbinata]|uniref:Glycoside hydrolase family 17 n=1 Tax=Dillenia turbinata TaxID=194707 RepID=A0AAN8Z2H7_9MAGN